MCGKSKLEQKIYSENKITPKTLFSGKIRRYFSFQNFIDPIFLLFGFFQSLIFFRKWRPDAVFSKGGFTAVPPILAAAILKIPIFIHETDAASGLANRLSAKFATKIWRAFDGIGNPVRDEIFAGDPRKIPKFQKPNLPLIFGFFGSQGAQKINELFFEIADKIPANILWVVGDGKMPKKTFPENIRLFEFVGKNFPDFLAAADLVISRAGGGIFEIAAAKKPAILVPLKSAANRHQEKNAEILAKNNAAEIFDEEKSAAEFLKMIKNLLKNPEKRKKLAKNIAKFSPKKAAERIADELLKLKK